MFMTEYRLASPIRVFGHGTDHIAFTGSSVMAIWSVRHPNMLIRWARRGFGAWSAWRLVKATLRQQQLR